MKVYVLTQQPYHDSTHLVGAYWSLAGAIEASPHGEGWVFDGFYRQNWEHVVAERDAADDEDFEVWLIYEFDAT
jgi:hypothetical protein